MTSLRKEEPSSFLDIERQFEIIKRTLKGKRSRKFNISVPYTTLDFYCQQYHAKDLREVIRSSIYGNDVSLKHDVMQINSDLVRNFFKATIDNIVNLMESVYADYKDSHEVTAIAMFGDYSNCILVEEAVRQTFPKKDIIATRNQGLEVMLGSVLCGHWPNHYHQISPPEMKAAQSSVTKCIFCNNPGIYHCTECTSAFCQECRTKHDKLPTTKNHTVTDLKKFDPSAFSTNAMCVLHKSEFIYFCTRCHILICGKCVTTEHKGHDITDIKTIANDYRRRAEGNISDLKVEVTMLSTVVGHMTKIEKPTIKRTSETAVAEIGETVVKITKAVSFTKEKKLDDVHSQLDMEMEEFQYDLKNKERIYEHQKNICESLERLMHVSHDITFITSYETLKRDIYDINDFVGEREQKQVYKFDKKGFVQEAVNAIVSGFDMSLVGKEDGSVVLMHRTEIQKKEKENKQK
ncbi:uncharacterized protein [Mytilus edulis]|uniref:uncharacterized protein n=1 Tax=Mytilus edulis TaxID=6550 RepID=UPI0039F0E98D